MKHRRSKALRRRYGHTRVKGVPGLAAWSKYGGGSYQLVYEGRTYLISPKHRLDERRRAGGWSLSLTPATHGLHGWISPSGEEHGGGFRYDFATPQSAAVAARKFAARVGHEPHGIMKKWAENEDKLDAIMRSSDFWHRVGLLEQEAIQAGDPDMARICRVAISNHRGGAPLTNNPDARKCARAMWEAEGMR